MDTKIREIDSRRHRETPKDKFKILEVNKNSKQIGYKLTLERVIENIENALNKVQIEDDIIIYKAVGDGRLRPNDINIFELNPEKELKRVLGEITTKITLFKVNLKRGANAIGYTNSIFYDNRHKTLPAGMNFDSKMLVDVSKLNLEQVDKTTFKIIKFENDKNDFTGVSIRTVDVIELEEKESLE